MPTLVLINGAPASGKSTVARLLARDRPLTLVVDIDTIRGSLGHWEDDPVAAGLAARQLALSMCGTHLSAGRDVIVPQFLQRAEFIDELAAAANDVGADFLECCLVSSPEQAAAQFAARASSDEPNHRAAQTLQSAPGAVPVQDLYETMLAMVSKRPQTRYVRLVSGDVEQSLAHLRAEIRQ
ncbi:AAA family ATPase [Nesterenkonia ebinurensis]|uniref:AAA family ATPase n=1 Tax=Nesterenkonia ebinurensis TaxID=2608252 RepID=UPI00123D2E43|nr:AAA family ATPase [Nesterenkonia ebinurensis]